MENVHPLAVPAGGLHAASLRPSSLGLALGILTGAFHLLWAILVWAGFAQPLIDFIFRLHMIEPPYRIAPFDPVTAIGLIVFTTAAGYVSGWCLGFLWKYYSRRVRAS